MKTFVFSLWIGGLAVALGGCAEEIVFPATGTVYGTLVYDDGSRAAGIRVLVEGAGLTGISDGNGEFVINGVLAVNEEGMGKYYTIRGEGERNGTSIGFLVDHFKVKGQQSYSVGTIEVPPTGSIRGGVNLAGNDDHSGVRVLVEGTSLETISRADGSYLFERLPVFDEYRLVCSKSGFVTMTLEWVPGSERETRISVQSGEQTVLNQTALDPGS